MRDVWQGMNLMSGRQESSANVVSDSFDYVNDLSKFYTRFDCHDFKRERENIINKLKEGVNQNSARITISQSSVFDAMKHINPNKACGLRGFTLEQSKRVLNNCVPFFILFSICLLFNVLSLANGKPHVLSPSQRKNQSK